MRQSGNVSSKTSFGVSGYRGHGAMPSDIDREKQWRSLAAETRARAEEMTDSQSRQIMLKIAASYSRLADRAREEREKKSR